MRPFAWARGARARAGAGSSAPAFRSGDWRRAPPRRRAPGRAPGLRSRARSKSQPLGDSSSYSRFLKCFENRQGVETASQDGLRIDAPPALEEGRIVAAKIHGMGQVAFAVEAIERGSRAVQPALHCASHDQVRGGGAVIGASALVLARAAAELGIGR